MHKDTQHTTQESCAIAKMTAQCGPYMGDLKIFGTPWLYPGLIFPKIFPALLFSFALWMCIRNLKSVALPVPKSIGGTPQLGQSLAMPTQGEAVGGPGWYRSKKRWWFPIDGPSIVTFPLSLRVSEILPLLYLRTPLFPYPTSSLPQISPCSPGSRWIAFSLQRANVMG